jgi:hypothetical protein
MALASKQPTFGHFPNSVKETRQVASNWLISSIRVLIGRNMGQMKIGADDWLLITVLFCTGGIP